MITASTFYLGNILLREEQQIDTQNLNFETFKSLTSLYEITGHARGMGRMLKLHAMPDINQLQILHRYV